jgi:hypothetical protein
MMFAASLAAAANANTTNGERMETPVDSLKRLYLVCERAAINGTLSPDGVAYCSAVYDELTRRAFGGNFEKLWAWAKEQQVQQHAGRR